MSNAAFFIGDVFDVLATLPDDSVDLVLSSPPFLALRSYLPADHPDKDKEIGSEATPADFLDTLLDVVEACDRVLAPHGSLVFELGDCYAGSGGAGGDYGDGGLRHGQAKFAGSALADRKNKVLRTDGNRLQQGRGWPLDKSLVGVPTLFAWSLAYGRNLLRPERTTEPWRIRNVVIWARPNPPVGALGDKFRPATSYLTVATKARDRFFDLDAVRTDYAELTLKNKRRAINGGEPINNGMKAGHMSVSTLTHAGAPPLDYWEIPTQPYSGSHYATWAEKLLTRPILSMCPERVCRVCGEPSRRITETVNAVGHRPISAGAAVGRQGEDRFVRPDMNAASSVSERVTLAWTDCQCSTDGSHWRKGVVLDPFGGSGTTGQVATGHGRNCVLVDIDERNAALAAGRIGMFCEVARVGDLPGWLSPAPRAEGVPR